MIITTGSTAYVISGVDGGRKRLFTNWETSPQVSQAHLFICEHILSKGVNINY